MALCVKCGGFTKFNGGKCYSCYKKDDSNAETSTIKETSKTSDEGLSKKALNYRYNMIKGRIAETLIQELFLSLDYNVFHYGMENTIPGIMELLKGVNSEVATDIRRMPDFVIQNPKTNEVFFIEVKFRKSGEFLSKHLAKDYPYRNAYFIIVSKKHIKCISVKELEAGKDITTKSRNYLGSRKEFSLDKEVILNFCDFAVQFFDGVE